MKQERQAVTHGAGLQLKEKDFHAKPDNWFCRDLTCSDLHPVFLAEDVASWARQLADEANDIVDFSPPFYPACKETDKLCKGCQDDLQRVYDKVRKLESKLLLVTGDEKT